MNRLYLMLFLLLFASSHVLAQSKNISMQAKSANGKQVAIPTAGKKTDAILGQTSMLVDGRVYPFIGFSYVSCEGDSATGTVRVRVEAKAKNEAVMVRFGVNCGENVCVRALDVKGNLFEGTVVDDYQGKTLPVEEPVTYEFVFEGVPVGLDVFKFVKAEYEMCNGGDVYSSQESNPIGVKHARIEWKNL